LFLIRKATARAKQQPLVMPEKICGDDKKKTSAKRIAVCNLTAGGTLFCADPELFYIQS
jgi:hypothetical protein